jgi:hypothetical protein
MSQHTTKFFRCYFKLTTCFDLWSGTSSGHKIIYSRKLYSISHEIYQSKTISAAILIGDVSDDET